FALVVHTQRWVLVIVIFITITVSRLTLRSVIAPRPHNVPYIIVWLRWPPTSGFEGASDRPYPRRPTLRPIQPRTRIRSAFVRCRTNTIKMCHWGCCQPCVFQLPSACGLSLILLIVSAKSPILHITAGE